MESSTHMDYVRVVASYIVERFPADDCAFMELDLPEEQHHPDHVINGYRPDVYLSSPQLAIIGEAKTAADVRNKHTQEQLVSYVAQLKTQDKERHLVVCTSLLAMSELKNMIRRLGLAHDFTGVRIHCLNDVGINTAVWDL